MLIPDSIWAIFQTIDEEYDGKLSPSQVLQVICKQYIRWQRIAELYEKELREKEDKMKNLEYEMRQKLKSIPKEEKLDG